MLTRSESQALGCRISCKHDFKTHENTVQTIKHSTHVYVHMHVRVCVSIVCVCGKDALCMIVYLCVSVYVQRLSGLSFVSSNIIGRPIP